MDPIRFAGFTGGNPKVQPRLLPDSMGVLVENHKPGQGDLTPWKVPLAVSGDVPAGRQTIYRFGRDSSSDTSYWFSWTTRVQVARAFLAEDTTERTYYTQQGVLKWTDNTLALAGTPYPTSFRQAAIPAPTTAPTLTETTPGTGDDETRFYAYVFVNDIGEVSAPSPVSAPFVCKPGAIIAIAGLDTVPGGSHGINRIRIYRTLAGASGSSEFFFLREIAAATTSTDDARALNTSDTMESAGPPGVNGRQWSVPPADIKGLVGLWNGMMAAISGKSVRVCEPYHPYAWPPAYETLTQDTPVALATFAKTLLVLTTGTPLLLYGSAPEALDGPPVEFVAPCLSEAGVVTFKHGAAWPSSEGVAYIGTSGPPRILTRDFFTVEAWRALNPATMVGCQYQGRYFCFYDTGSGWKGFHLDPLNPEAGVVMLSTGYPAAYFDELQGTMYVLNGASVQKWDAGATFMTATARSKVFRLPRASNPAVAEVIADAYPVTFKLWAGRYAQTGWPAGSLKLTKTVTDRGVFRLPAGYLADDVQIEVSAAGPITGAVVAGSIDDIRQT